MHPKNIYASRIALIEWEAQGFSDAASDGIRVDGELESYNGGSLPRLALRFYRRAILLAVVYGYQTRANMLADTSRDVNVGALTFADATNANNDLYFRTSSTWVADTLWGMSNAFKNAITTINASQTLQTTTPTPGPPGAGVPADGQDGNFLGFASGVPAWQRYMPVQQGGGAGQFGNKVRIGWGGAAKLQVQVDELNLGQLWTDYLSPVSFTIPGYVKLPNGLIIQFGASTNPASDYTITFPMAFPTSALGVWATPSSPGAAPTLMHAVMTSNVSKTSMDIRTRYATNGGVVGGETNRPVFWMAMGF